ncbi:MAG: prepilin peptidase [Alkaliphilus sp.]|nr:prepilin peptidase [Alkaliphilus sp. AH-315-G20]PHS36505.1 MAG: prepilin peptidase [Alkaliphilus sp.]
MFCLAFCISQQYSCTGSLSVCPKQHKKGRAKLTLFFVCITALLVGSFLNVCIYRIPKNKSIVAPPSSCGSCDTRLGALDLVPVLSYVFSKGMCRHCGAKYSPRYMIVELLNAALWTILYLELGLTVIFVFYAFITSVLVVITFIDFDFKIIPDRLNVSLLVVGIIFNLLLFWFTCAQSTGRFDFIIDGFIGFLIGGLLFLAIAVVTGAMGGGDIKLMAVLGLILGWQSILLITLLSFVIGAVISLILLITKIKGRKDEIPFGPFIALATYITILFGQEIINYYLLTMF